MFLLLILLFALGFLLAYLFSDEQFYTINKTVGWAYNFSKEIILTAFITYSQICFIIGYFILYLLKRKTNYYISIAHFEIILLTLYSITFQNFTVTVVFCLLSVVLFFVNIFKSHQQKIRLFLILNCFKKFAWQRPNYSFKFHIQ